MTKTTNQDEAAYIRPSEAAKLAFVGTKTLARMADKGRIHSLKLDSGHRRYLRTDVLSLLTPQVIPAAPVEPVSPEATGSTGAVLRSPAA